MALSLPPFVGASVTSSCSSGVVRRWEQRCGRAAQDSRPWPFSPGAAAVVAATFAGRELLSRKRTYKRAWSLWASLKPLEAPSVEVDGRLQCKWCGQAFPSRSRLFDHLRTNQSCASAVEKANPQGAAELAARGQRHCAVFMVGYFSDGSTGEELVRRAVQAAGGVEIELSRASSDDHRSAEKRDCTCGESILRQEAETGAVADVITARFGAPVAGEALFQRLLTASHDLSSQESAVANVIDVRLLPRGCVLHAETSCTQRIYGYLLPLRIVDTTGKALEEVSRHVEQLDRRTKEILSIPISADSALQHTVRTVKRAVKAMLRAIDSERGEADVAESGTEEETDEEGARAQRFSGIKLYGSESRRRLRWHNFAPPELAGNLSPQKEAVICALDRIVATEVVYIDGQGYIDLLIAGDRFLTQQVRRLVASVVCVQRGWLPPDYLYTASRADVVLSTPLSPGELCYLKDCNFTVWTRRYGRIFDRSWVSKIRKGSIPEGREEEYNELKVPGEPDWDEKGAELEAAAAERLAAWRCRLLYKAVQSAPSSEQWEQQLRAFCEGERLKEELERVRQLDAFAAGEWAPPLPAHDLTELDPECPAEYHEVLRLLTQLLDSGRWPGTSPARSKVIRRLGGSTIPEALGGGTFSLSAPSGGALCGQKLPKADDKQEIAELRSAIFELELALAPGRPQSSMVAVNCNALFAPHTDAGAGLGQSSSLIVGLGCYSGGKLAVEGEICDIRYKPLEFNGWRQRHWTLPYTGRRFSLVWFTPAAFSSDTTHSGGGA